MESLLLKKIDQCCYLFDFSDPTAELRGKEVKRAALSEMLEFISASKGVLTDPVYPEILRMVSTDEKVLSVCLSVCVCAYIRICIHACMSQ